MSKYPEYNDKSLAAKVQRMVLAFNRTDSRREDIQKLAREVDLLEGRVRYFEYAPKDGGKYSLSGREVAELLDWFREQNIPAEDDNFEPLTLLQIIKRAMFILD
jgi:hypothetical protein